VAIDGSGLPVCDESKVNGDRGSTVLKGLTPCGVDPDDGLTCLSKRLPRTVTQNRHFYEQAELVIRLCAHPDSARIGEGRWMDRAVRVVASMPVRRTGF